MADQEKCYYNAGYDLCEGGYLVKSRFQGDCVIAIFICEADADNFVNYRNYMLCKYDTSNVKKYDEEWKD